MKPQIIAVVLLTLVLQACATVYTNDDFSSYQETHKKVAIIPFDVSIDAKNYPKDMNLDMLKESELQEGVAFQKQMYSQFLNKYQKGAYTVKFQDVDETNVLLRRNNMDQENLADFTKAEIGKALGVDSMISGTIKRAKPMSTGAAVAAAFLVGISATNEVNVNVTLHESNEGSLLWSYDHQVTGGLGSSPERLSKNLMKSMSNKFPYGAK